MWYPWSAGTQGVVGSGGWWVRHAVVGRLVSGVTGDPTPWTVSHRTPTGCDGGSLVSEVVHAGTFTPRVPTVTDPVSPFHHW